MIPLSSFFFFLLGFSFTFCFSHITKASVPFFPCCILALCFVEQSVWFTYDATSAVVATDNGCFLHWFSCGWSGYVMRIVSRRIMGLLRASSAARTVEGMRVGSVSESIRNTNSWALHISFSLLVFFPHPRLASAFQSLENCIWASREFQWSVLFSSPPHLCGFTKP